MLVLNGPNLNLLGRREPEIYGRETLDDIMATLSAAYPSLRIDHFQSNHEGELIDRLHQCGFDDECLGVVFNAGGYTHSSVALGDAIRAIKVPVVEVHISNVSSRESFRQVSMIGGACLGTIAGFGSDVYRLGIEALLHR